MVGISSGKLIETYRSSTEVCEILNEILKIDEKFSENGWLEVQFIYRIKGSKPWPDFSCLMDFNFLFRSIEDINLQSKFKRKFDVAVLVMDEEFLDTKGRFDMILLKKVLRPYKNVHIPNIFVIFTSKYNMFELLTEIYGKKMDKSILQDMVLRIQEPEKDISLSYYSNLKEEWNMESWKFGLIDKIKKERKSNKRGRHIRTIENNIPFFSEINEDGKLKGLEGETLTAICKANDWTSYSRKINEKDNVAEMFFYNQTDINLNTYTNPKLDVTEVLDLYEIDGSCFMVPVNIQTSFFDNILIPFDAYTLAMMFISTLTTCLVWKLLSSQSRSKFPFSFIFINIFKCSIGMGFDHEDKISRKEKILLYSFLFSSILLVSLYQSILIAIMLTNVEMRSIQSFQELNQSNTKIYAFLSKSRIKFRDDLVMTKISSATQLESIYSLPSDYDPNLAYLVPCSYAEAFVGTSLNFKDGKKIFNILPEVLAKYSSSYLVNRNFPYIKQLKFAVEQLRESGIRNYWKSNLLVNSHFHSTDNEKSSMINLKRFWFPFVILAIGASLGCILFLCEQIIYYIKYKRGKKVQKFQFHSTKKIYRKWFNRK